MWNYFKNLFNCRRCKKMKQGDMVIYVCEFDADKSYSPNTAPGLVIKVHDDNSLDLQVSVIDGVFWKRNVPYSRDETARETWHQK